MFETGYEPVPAGDITHPLDSEENNQLLNLLRSYWFEARAAHTENRNQQAIDEDFVDGIQWEAEDIEELNSRGQKPLVYNEIKPAVEWTLGTERRTRVEWKVLPRGNEDRESAETKTKLLKYIADVNKSEFMASRAFADAVKVGNGWMEFGVHIGGDGEPIYERYESWRNIWLDPLSMELDISDARYLMRSKIVDYDIAKAMFPDRLSVLNAGRENAFNEYGVLYDEDLHDVRQNIDTSMSKLAGLSNDSIRPSNRKVVRLIECWYRVPETVKIMRGYGQFDGQVFDAKNMDMVLSIESGDSSVFESVRMQVRVAVFCAAGLLQDMVSPYRHNRFPFVPLWAYRRGRDNMSYGLPRGSRDPQEDLNKRRSKALFMLSVNRTIMDEGAVDDLDEYIEEVARPDAVIVKKSGKELSIETNIQLAEEHIMLANQSADYIRHISGVTGENMGQETNATSGKAILARQNQGTVVTASLFDNKRLFIQLTGEIRLSLVEQFMDYKKVVRIVGERGAQEFLTINETLPDGTILNPVTKSQADFKVAEQDYRESVRMAMFEQLLDMLSKMSGDVAMSVLDIVFDYSDLPGKDEIVRRIRQINGYADPSDPDADKIEKQNRSAKEQAQQEQVDLEKRRVNAEIRAKLAQAEQNEATSQKTKLDSMATAFQAALQVLQAQPAVAQTANDLLQGADAAKPGQSK